MNCTWHCTQSSLTRPSAELDYFRQRPEPFYTLAKELYPGNFRPTHCHYFVKLLHQKGLLVRNFTQNIDTLERIAGVPEEKLVEAHGSFASAHCIACRQEYSQEFVRSAFRTLPVNLSDMCTCGRGGVL